MILSDSHIWLFATGLLQILVAFLRVALKYRNQIKRQILRENYVI